MVYVTRFLLRWLYLNNILRDRVDIQSLPQQPPLPPQQQQQVEVEEDEVSWRRHCLQGILSYPPGSTSRLLAIESHRLEIIHNLAHQLHTADEIIQSHHLHTNHDNDNEEEEDPFYDADLEIIQAFEQATTATGTAYFSDDDHDHDESDDDAVLVISPNNDNHDSNHNNNNQEKDQTSRRRDGGDGLVVTEEEVMEAKKLHLEAREYLPQLVSAIFHSPSLKLQQMNNNHNMMMVDPSEVLKKLILTRCIRDPSLGIDLCWLLEAEVGRAWKTLLEHRQQTGKRLIVVLPAEKAAVIAQIGRDKKAAFEFLQDVEQATAYGYMPPTHTHTHLLPIIASQYYTTPKLPASLSYRRCSHFGDTMHFMDCMTQLSLDLQLVPTLERKSFLHSSLQDLNRRLRRRMITKGTVSLDVQDNTSSVGTSPSDWPRTQDLTADLLHYSVHFPLEPKSISWPPYTASSNHKRNLGLMRVLNIVWEESRILASRERCPYLVQLEVCDTGYQGSDARLYAAGAGNKLGATLQEILSRKTYHVPTELISHPTTTSPSSSFNHKKQSVSSSSSTITLDNEYDDQEDETNDNNDDEEEDTTTKMDLDDETLTTTTTSSSVDDLRGGSSYPNHPDGYDWVRQEQLEQLHEQMQPPHYHPPHHSNYHPYQYTDNPNHPQQQSGLPSLTTRSVLLDKVFGLPWIQKCEQIRQASPFGNVPGWRLASFIMKAGEDIRREALVMQVISKLNDWFAKDIPPSNRPYLRPYSIMCIGGDAGLLECLPDAKSIDEVKKETDGFTSLREYFERAYGPPQSRTALQVPLQQQQQQQSYDGSIISFEQAQDNFLRSLVGYSLVCYILQIKDRHNANILLDREGHIMHIDFGFVLGDTPKMGKVPLFSERAPFKLTAEFWDVIGGWNMQQGGLGVKFCKMFEAAFAVASAHADELVTLIESALLNLTRNPREARSMANGVKSRLTMKTSPIEQKTFIMDLVNTALTSWGTSTYDWLQKSMNGYI